MPPIFGGAAPKQPGATAVPGPTIPQLAARLTNQGVPEEEAVKQAANIRLDKAFDGLEDADQIRRLVQEVIGAGVVGIKLAWPRISIA